MDSKPLRVEIRRVLLKYLAEQGLSTVSVLASYQPTSQGVERDSIYFFRVGDPRVGWQGRAYDPATGIRVERQIIESTFQFGALVKKDSAFEADDLLGKTAMIIQSLSFIDECQLSGIGVQRIPDMRTPYFKNEKGQFEQSPSFDVVFSHQQTISQAQRFTTQLDPDFSRVEG